MLGLQMLFKMLFHQTANNIRKLPHHSSLLTQHPHNLDRDAWQNYWQEMAQPWRTEPEIDLQRQVFLAHRRAIVPDVEPGSYPFSDVKLSRADIEWLLAMHDNGQGPINWADQNQRSRKGLDLRGSILNEEDLNALPLAHVIGGLTWKERLKVPPKKRYMAEIRMEGVNLTDAHMEGAFLGWARMKGANLSMAYLEAAMLDAAHPEGTDLSDTDLKGTQLKEAHLESAYLEKANCEKSYLCEAFFDSGTQLINVSFDSALLADIRWGSTNLAVLNWLSLKRLGDEMDARQSKKDTITNRLTKYYRAVRANRQIAVALQSHGLNEDAARFAYRAQVLQKSVFHFQMLQPGKTFIQRIRLCGAWLFSWFLFILAGYGYRFGRTLLWYVLAICGFAFSYSKVGSLAFVPDAIVFSLMSFHGRGFFPNLNTSTSLTLHHPLIILASVEAVVGLIIELSFIATFTQRFFGEISSPSMQGYSFSEE